MARSADTDLGRARGGYAAAADGVANRGLGGARSVRDRRAGPAVDVPIGGGRGLRVRVVAWVAGSLIALCWTSCQTAPARDGAPVAHAPADEVRSRADVAARAGETVAVRGIYVEIDVRKKRTDPPVLRGHVALRLDDGALVRLLPSGDAAAIRPEVEREALRGAEVVAEGVLHEACPAGDETLAQLATPCLSPLRSVVAPDLGERTRR